MFAVIFEFQSKNFYRLQFSLRPWALARIREGVFVMYTAGWPVEIRGGILRGTEKELTQRRKGAEKTVFPLRLRASA